MLVLDLVVTVDPVTRYPDNAIKVIWVNCQDVFDEYITKCFLSASVPLR